MLPRVVQIPSNRAVDDPHFKAAVYVINPGYSNIGNRAISYNRYFNIFKCSVRDNFIIKL